MTTSMADGALPNSRRTGRISQPTYDSVGKPRNAVEAQIGGCHPSLRVVCRCLQYASAVAGPASRLRKRRQWWEPGGASVRGAPQPAPRHNKNVHLDHQWSAGCARDSSVRRTGGRDGVLEALSRRRSRLCHNVRLAQDRATSRWAEAPHRLPLSLEAVARVPYDATGSGPSSDLPRASGRRPVARIDDLVTHISDQDDHHELVVPMRLAR
jgi:hypothetical protein